ncbi:diguanylate cyclase [Desulfobacula phenolica]|uniref:diguanylate cyclase n=1 Tax=Desulfobacula phenolica TaxID=90732 RepID=A0A1H2DN74_9BACT|nr:diguanylate cyclase [Desulfobacula phenolica]SDT84387.1 diguanylate cyclase (GGDEF) domain-containing protein [Desulfobacula phenolica]
MTVKKTKKTILVVDDTETNLDMILAILKEYDVIPVTSGEDALLVLKEEKIDMILLDILMPGMDGFEVCNGLKADGETKNIPVIFITAKNDEDSIEKAYELGGVDYVTKPFRPRELMARVKTHLCMQEIIDNLGYLATRDSLTGVYNRRKFFELAQSMYELNKEGVFSIMIDLDHFKNINDLYGHQSGDVVLRSITKAISDLLPEESVFGRVGGEEFAVLVVASKPDEVKNLVEIIRITVSQLIVLIGDSTTISCTISCGMAQRTEATLSLDDLLKEADIALYQAKGGGRNRSIFR